MGKDLKDSWKETGIGLGHAFRDLGKTLIKTGAVAMKKADEWANQEENAEPTATENKDSETEKKE